MIREIVRSVSEISTDIKKSFNPDKRIEAGTTSREVKSSEANTAKYNPDKRVKPDIKEISIDKLLQNYIKEMKKFSEFPETLKNADLKTCDIKRPSMEEMRAKKKEFSDIKNDLIKQWETATCKEWPRYKKDVYDKNGNKIRNAGDRYDAHHIKPLSWGGENKASNITPLSAEVHYDHRGVHRIGGAYDQITKKMKEA